jgi:hypothetical protein
VRKYLGIILIGLAGVAYAGPPGGSFIQNQNVLQQGATFYVSSGTITNLQTTNLKFNDGTIQTTAATGGGGSSSLNVSIGGVTVSSPTSKINFSSFTFTAVQGPNGVSNINVIQVDTSTALINYAWLYNGTKGVWAAQGTNFAFSITSFSDSLPSVFEIGTGVWKTAGNITFTASYGNGPATSGTVSGGTSLTMTNSFQGPTATTSNVNYPGVAGAVTFTLNAAGAAGSASTSITHNFNNDRFWGVSAQSGVYTSTDVTSLAGTDLTNAVANTFTVTPSATQYIVYAYPTRLGTATFTVGGFSGGFNPPQTLSITNASGFTENYYVYRSVNSNLGTTTVTAS